MAFSHDGRTLALGSLRGEIELRDMGNGKRLSILRAHSDTVTQLAFDPGGRFLVSGSDDGTLRLWELE